MTAEETAAFEQDPHFEAAVALRRADDAGKVVGLRVPGLAYWRPTVGGAPSLWPPASLRTGDVWRRQSSWCGHRPRPGSVWRSPSWRGCWRGTGGSARRSMCSAPTWRTGSSWRHWPRRPRDTGVMRGRRGARSPGRGRGAHSRRRAGFPGPLPHLAPWRSGQNRGGVGRSPRARTGRVSVSGRFGGTPVGGQGPEGGGDRRPPGDHGRLRPPRTGPPAHRTRPPERSGRPAPSVRNTSDELGLIARFSRSTSVDRYTKRA